jgi:type IV pilus assembly protein PilC
VKREQVMHLSRQLSAFIVSGLPLTDAVRALGSEADNSAVRAMMQEVEAGLRAGDQLSDCVDRHPKIFPEFYRGILRSAELSGHLDTVLAQLARYLERDLEARRKVKAAMIYPAMIALMSVVTVVVLTSFVLPRFRDFFKSMGATLPLPTRMLLAIADFVSQWGVVLLGGFVVLGIVVFLALRTETGRYVRDRVFFAVPLLGVTIRFTLVERFCRVLSSMVSAGVGLPQALRVTTNSIRNVIFQRALADVGLAVLRGEGLTGPLITTGLFPNTATLMFRVGEDTGTLDSQLEVAAHFYEGELDYKIKKLTSLFEPAVIVAMGLVVGFVAVALVSAMYGIFNQVKV